MNKKGIRRPIQATKSIFSSMASVQILNSSLLLTNSGQHEDFISSESTHFCSNSSNSNDNTSLSTIDYDTSSTDLENIAFSIVMLIVEGRTPTPVYSKSVSTSALKQTFAAKENVHASWEIERITNRILELGTNGQSSRSESPSYRPNSGKLNRSTSVHVCNKNNNQVRF